METIQQSRRSFASLTRPVTAGVVDVAIEVRAVDHTGGSAARGGQKALPRDAGRVLQVKKNPGSEELGAALEKMVRGEHAALGVCYDLMGGVVFSLAVRMLRDRQAAEDVVQDIFAQVWRQASGFDVKRGSGEAWILMIARSRVLDRLRSRKAGVRVRPVGDHLPEEPDAEDWPDDLAVSREEASVVRTALLDLPKEQRELVELSFFDGLTHAEIAEKLTLPLGTVKTRIRLGLMRIREDLGDVINRE